MATSRVGVLISLRRSTLLTSSKLSQLRQHGDPTCQPTWHGSNLDGLTDHALAIGLVRSLLWTNVGPIARQRSGHREGESGRPQKEISQFGGRFESRFLVVTAAAETASHTAETLHDYFPLELAAERRVTDDEMKAAIGTFGTGARNEGKR
jgi:hypothetical protein